MNTSSQAQFGLVDNRFLAKSVGLMNPPNPELLAHDATLRDAIEMMQSRRIGCVLVTDDDGKISGVFTERDVLLKTVLKDIAPDTPISELMTPSPQCITMTENVAFALQLMSSGGYRHVPIVDNDIPVGIISVKDIVDFIVRSVTSEVEALA